MRSDVSRVWRKSSRERRSAKMFLRPGMCRALTSTLCSLLTSMRRWQRGERSGESVTSLLTTAAVVVLSVRMRMRPLLLAAPHRSTIATASLSSRKLELLHGALSPSGKTNAIRLCRHQPPPMLPAASPVKTATSSVDTPLASPLSSCSSVSAISPSHRPLGTAMLSR